MKIIKNFQCKIGWLQYKMVLMICYKIAQYMQIGFPYPYVLSKQR